MHTRGFIQSDEICADMAETYKNTPIISYRKLKKFTLSLNFKKFDFM